MITCCCILALASCSRPAKVYRIGVSQCSSDDWRSKMNDEIMRETLFHDNATVEIRSADDNSDKQISDIQYFIDNKFDIIIAAPNEAEPITPIIRKAYDSGIPVITFDRDIVGDSYTAHIEVDNHGLGKDAARYAVATTGAPLKILEIQGAPNMTPTTKRHNGFVDGLKPALDATLVASAYGNWEPERAAAIMDSVLDTRSDINLVYAHNDRMAIAASLAARRRGVKGIRFIGIDGSPNIGIKAVKDGVIDATFLYPTDGDVLVNMALDILEGKPYDRIAYLDPLSPVDSTNADILLRQSGLQDNMTRKVKFLQSKIDEYWDKHTAQTSLLYAVVALVVVMGGFFVMLYRMYWQHKRHKNLLQQQNSLLEQERDKQKVLYEQLESAMQSKLMFFTNVSHDLRTPLTLISEPVSQVLDHPDMPMQQRQTMMRIADKNVKILRRLIDQILDFRKYENGQLKLNASEVNFIALLREWAESFSSLARKRNIKLTLDLPDSACLMDVDVEKMQSVFFNLMSNAFKYTPDNGRIDFACSVADGQLTLSVRDNGAGIPREDLGRIFDRFYQVERIQPNGSGIGLALVKAFIELHGGSIEVSSVEHAGSTFTVTLPIRHSDIRSTELPQRHGDDAVDAELADIDNLNPQDSDQSKPLLLVIDDNRDILQLITGLLQDDYNIICAPDGQKGVRLAARYIPDLIITDVMMPVMDGMECCRIIKNEISTSHIPILMLTACSLDEQRTQGYACGADSYLPKPFNAAVLKARCNNLIDNRKRIKDQYSGVTDGADTQQRRMPAVQRQDIPGDIDNEFYARFIELVDGNMSDPDLTVDRLAEMMGLGKSQFTRKIKALTNYTPVEHIRNMRLKRARALLTSTDRTISQITYEVGFNQPAYFTKCFRDAFGETPSELRTRLGK